MATHARRAHLTSWPSTFYRNPHRSHVIPPASGRCALAHFSARPPKRNISGNIPKYIQNAPRTSHAFTPKNIGVGDGMDARSEHVPPAPRRHHVPTNVSRQGDGPAGKARHPRRARQHPDTGSDKKHHAAPHFFPTDPTQLCNARRTLPQKLPNADIRHTKHSQKPHNLMIFHPQLLNCVNT